MIASAFSTRCLRVNFLARPLAILRNESAIHRVFLIALFLTVGFRDGGAAPSILREVWLNIAGTAVSDLTNDPRYTNSPDQTNLLTTFFESPTDIAENYGQRVHGYIVPPVTGNYTFWIAADDNAELWLSSDSNPASAQRIAFVPGWTSSPVWGN